MPVWDSALIGTVERAWVLPEDCFPYHYKNGAEITPPLKKCAIKKMFFQV